MNVFGAYARYYDLLYHDKDYGAETDYILSLITRHAPEAKSILELGCGTGLHACLMAEKGCTVHGIDLSEEMLEAAGRRRANLPSQLQSRLSFAAGDVRTYRHACTFDVVVSLFHVFSYQTSNADLSSAFQTAAAHLGPGGILICDFWYGPAVLAQRPDVRVKRLQNQAYEIIRIAEPVLHENTNLVDVHYDIRITERASGKVETLSEKHQLRYIFLPELELIAAQNSMSCLQSFSWLTQDPPSRDSWSVGAVLVKH